MREIIHFQVGRCGNNIGYKFLEDISTEHGLNQDGSYIGTDDNQLKNISVFFNETEKKYTPRAILIDTEPTAIEEIMVKPYSKMFLPDNILYDREGTGNVYTKGYFCSQDLFLPVQDVVRREVEKCDCFQGFQYVHSTSGGTGSGVTSKMINTFREEYPTQIMQMYMITPDNDNQNPFAAYNSCFTLCNAVNAADLVHIIENQKLAFLNTKQLNIDKPSFDDINKLASLHMTGVTSSLRYPVENNLSLRKLAINLVPFIRKHFFLDSMTPLSNLIKKTPMSTKKLIQAMFDYDNFLAESSNRGSYPCRSIACQAILPDKTLSAMEIIQMMKKRKKKKFERWLPCGFQASVSDPPKNKEIVHFIANDESVQNIYKRIAEHYTMAFRHKAYIWRYDEMDEMEFTEMESNLSDLVTEYQHYA